MQKQRKCNYRKTMIMINEIQQLEKQEILTYREKSFLTKYHDMADQDKLVLVELLFKLRNSQLVNVARNNF